jgi:hypothetical protein
MIAYWKDLSLDKENPGLEKWLKIVNYQNCQKVVLSQIEKVGGH